MTTTLPTAAVAEWVRCCGCEHLLYGKRFARNLWVCPECGRHERLPAPARIAQLVDPDTFQPLPGDAGVLHAESADVLQFVDSLPYPQRLADARRSTGLVEAALSGVARIGGHPLVLTVMDFRFMGGSLGAGTGELVTQAAEAALRQRLPLLLVTASGGARMQEGCLSLMQMAKTTQAISALHAAGLLTITLVTDPTYGGVAASFATATDVIVAEAGARMGFAGPRVIEQTIGQRLPAGFQTAQFLLSHGLVDLVEERANLPGCLQRLLAAGTQSAARALPRGEAIIVRDPDAVTPRDAWEVVQLARDAERPTALDYISRIFDSFQELRGDRVSGDCSAIVAGLARLGELSVAVVGHQKGHTTKELLGRNFGMPRPEGYRKAARVMRLAAKLNLPVVTFVDTPGAYPGLQAEESGQASAIAQSIMLMGELPTPVVTVITGEGGSGGALALAVADRVLICELGSYSVISPEGCSAILWNTSNSAPEAARALRLTAPELLRLGIVDGVVPEPRGGTQRDPQAAANNVRAALVDCLAELLPQPPERLVAARRARFRQYGRPIAAPVLLVPSRPAAEEAA